MKKILTKEDIIEYKKSTNLVCIGNINIIQDFNDDNIVSIQTIYNIDKNNKFIYDNIFINGVIILNNENIIIYYAKDERLLYISDITTNTVIYTLYLKDNEYLIIKEVQNNLYIQNEKYSSELLQDNEVEYPIFKTNIEQDYNGKITGKISIKVDEEQINDFYIYGVSTSYKNDFNKVLNEISYIKDKFEKKRLEISNLINKYENCFIVYNQKVYKIINLNHISVELFLINSTFSINVKYIDLITNGFDIINENSLFSYNNNFYLDINGETLDEEDFNILNPILKDSKLEQVINMYFNINDAYKYNLNINIIKDMIKLYKQLKEEFINSLNRFEKLHLDNGIYYITDTKNIHISTYKIEQFDKIIENIEKEEE